MNKQSKESAVPPGSGNEQAPREATEPICAAHQERAFLAGAAHEHEKTKQLARLLLEARDALPAISETSAKLHGVSLSLADRIEKALEPWRVE